MEKYLRYTIFVKSALSQPMVHRNREWIGEIAAINNLRSYNSFNEQEMDEVKRTEGILIETYKKHYGRLPTWNSIGGAVDGQRNALQSNIEIINSFSNPQDYNISPLVSRSTIRELSNNPTYERYESFLHTIRMFILDHGMDYSHALSQACESDTYGTYQEIQNTGYLEKPLII